MSTRIAAPVLTVDAGKMQGIDTRNVENLFGMWTVFSRCAQYMEEGRRLENLSWRIWNRETFCCETQPQFSTTPSMLDFRRPHPKDSMPSLSTSVDSVTSQDDEREHHQASQSLPLDSTRVYGSKSSIESHSSSRGREKHITSLGLKKMVASIKEQKKLQPLSPSISEAVPSFLPPPTASEVEALYEPSSRRSSSSVSSHGPLSSPESVPAAAKSNGSDTSAELITTHSVVHGFAQGQISSSFRSQIHLAPSPVPVKSSLNPARADAAKEKRGMFFTGASSEEDSSYEDKMSLRPTQQSSLTAGLKKSLGKKQTSFKDEVESRTINNRSHQDEDVFESDDEDVSESAIEDEEDSSDWEDSATDSGESSVNEKHLFQRVDSRHNLVSRRSLLTTLIHQPDRAAALAQMAAKNSKSSPALHQRRSRTSSPNGPSVAASPEADSMLTMDPRVPRSRPIIMTTSNTHPPALSPRTTRRNMLATELTESLRKHLLWERQQKNITANAVLKRRHTAHDNMTKLTQFPNGTVAGTGTSTSRTNSWNHEPFDYGLGEYHQRGW